MLIGYGDVHRSSSPAVLTSNHLVREVPRTLVPDERRAVLARRPPRPRQHPRGTCCGIHAERSCHVLVSSAVLLALCFIFYHLL